MNIKSVLMVLSFIGVSVAIPVSAMERNHNHITRVEFTRTVNRHAKIYTVISAICLGAYLTNNSELLVATVAGLGLAGSTISTILVCWLNRSEGVNV